MSKRASPDLLYVYQFPYWKHPVVKQCFIAYRVIFIESTVKLPANATLVLWGRRAVPEGTDAQVKIWRMEDGFLRSVGLGADLVRPMSWIVDRSGIYYDATQSSDLERMLMQSGFDLATLARAAELRTRVVAAGLTKYNVGAVKWQRPARISQVILVPGQVESDASLAYGAPAVRGNIALLKAVRSANPEAYVIYKPHPDVYARLRAEGRREQDAHYWCDEVLTDVAMGALLAQVDEVHVMTSLAGFEALLRGKAVTCYGQPFYAGWGLTTDRVTLVRRTKSLTLDELVAGVLISYPLYLSRNGRQLITPEQALDELSAWLVKSSGHTTLWRKFIRLFLRRIIGVR